MREGKNEESKNTINITMREGKSAMNIFLFYSTSSFLNRPEHWDAWLTSVIGTTESMGQRMWTKFIVLWTPSKKQPRTYLRTLLKGGAQRQPNCFLCPFPPLSQNTLHYSEKKISWERVWTLEFARKDRNLSISGPQFRNSKSEISGIWCDMVGWKKTCQHNNCFPRGMS